MMRTVNATRSEFSTELFFEVFIISIPRNTPNEGREWKKQQRGKHWREKQKALMRHQAGTATGKFASTKANFSRNINRGSLRTDRFPESFFGPAFNVRTWVGYGSEFSQKLRIVWRASFNRFRKRNWICC